MRWCLLTLTACIGSDNAPDPVELPLTSLPGFEIDIDASDSGIRIGLTTADEYSQPCPRLLPSFEATIDGISMTVERGHVTDIGLDSPEYVCSLPSLYSTERGELLHIADTHASFDIELGDAPAYRMMQVPSTTLARGDAFDITWSSAMDLANMPSVDVHINYVAAAVAVDGAGIHVTSPSAAELPQTGSLPVDVRVRSQRPCPYPNCRIIATHSLRDSITVQ
jgi:hypothetical protein